MGESADSRGGGEPLAGRLLRVVPWPADGRVPNRVSNALADLKPWFPIAFAGRVRNYQRDPSRGPIPNLQSLPAKPNQAGDINPR